MSLFLFAGETSADLYGRRILSHLPDIEVWGVGGKELEKAGQKQLLTVKDFAVMGFSDVLRRFPTILKNFLTIRNAILKKNPKVVLFIDQPAFGMRLARALRKKGYKGKIVQFVAPTVWAYNPQRADKMAESFDLLLTLFDFEPHYFAHTKLKTRFVGHPILEIIEEQNSASLAITGPIISLFPGSRPDEIRRNLSKQLEAAKLVQNEVPGLQIAICADVEIEGTIKVPFELRYELMKKSMFAIAKSGTVTLELALLGVPTVVMYELTLLNRLMAKYLLKIDRLPYYSIANIVAGYGLFPELIRPPVTAQDIANKLLSHKAPIEKEKIDAIKTKLSLKTSATKAVAMEINALLS